MSRRRDLMEWDQVSTRWAGVPPSPLVWKQAARVAVGSLVLMSSPMQASLSSSPRAGRGQATAGAEGSAMAKTKRSSRPKGSGACHVP